MELGALVFVEGVAVPSLGIDRESICPVLLLTLLLYDIIWKACQSHGWNGVVKVECCFLGIT
jgi:hypothetical protein